MYKKVNFLGYLLILSASGAGAAEGPHTNTAEDYFKVLQKEHKQTIQKGGDILKTYLHRVNHLSTLAFISDQINEHIQNVVRNSGSILENHIMEFKEGLKDGVRKDEHLLKILQDHAAALKRGMAALPQTDAFIASHFKVCADCLSRVVITHFPSHILNWAEEIPLRIKNEEEEIRHKESVDYTKRHILKGRRIAQTWTGWMTVLSSPFAAVFAYAAIKKPSLVTVALATGTTAWTGYNGIRYNIITNLPAPTDEQVYKIWAHNKNLELP